MIWKETLPEGSLWWTRLPRIPVSVEDAKSLPQEGSVVFICDCEIKKGFQAMHKLMRMVEKNNPDWTVCVWHNHRRDRMIAFRRRNGF